MVLHVPFLMSVIFKENNSSVPATLILGTPRLILWEVDDLDTITGNIFSKNGGSTHPMEKKMVYLNFQIGERFVISVTTS